MENYLHTEGTTLEGTFLLICRKSAPFSCLSRLIYMGLHFLCTHITTYCVRVSTMETGHWHSAGHWELSKTWEPGLNYLVHCAWCWQLFLPLEKSMLRYLCLVCDTGNVVMFDPHYVQLPDWLYCCNFPLCTWDMIEETPVGHHSDRTELWILLGSLKWCRSMATLPYPDQSVRLSQSLTVASP